MKNLYWIILLVVLITSSTNSIAQNIPQKQVLKELLTEFLANVDSKEMHDRFWADDLIYTSSSGRRFGKATIMEGFNPQPENDGKKPKDNSNKPSYTADDVEIKIYGNTAVVAFKLVGISSDGTLMEFLNSGTFVKRNKQWKAVNWQATKIDSE